MKQKLKLLILPLLAIGLLSTAILPSPAHAASTIVVNSTADDEADDGECTLREAIIAANDDTASGITAGECIAGSGTDTIEFNITGSADFANAGQDGYTIEPQSGLPSITETLTIDGYSQPGAQANTAAAPNPLNGVLLIEIDGTNAGTNVSVFHLDTGSDNSQIKGLVVGSFSDSAAFSMEASDIVIQGNYIGTNPAGTTARPNGIGVTHGGVSGTGVGALIGGLNPADRNIISGNTDGNAAAAGYPSTEWVIQGNYVGVGADGATAVPNATVNGSGAFSIDDCSDVLVGGSQPGAANVISGNLSYGIAPDNSPGLRIAGNYIGTDYTGTQTVANAVGVLLSGDQENTSIGGSTVAERNIISGNTRVGVLTGSSAGTIQIAGNYIGLNKTGVAALPNGAGVLISDGTIVGGNDANRNVISGNTLFNVSVQGLQVPSVGAKVSGNYIGTNASGNIDPVITAVQGEGVRVSANTTGSIIGGTTGNVIAGNRGAGVSVRSLTITQFSITATPSKSAILGNHIYGNVADGPLTGEGLGIDHYKATVSSLGGFPADLQADSYIDLGVNVNDSDDPDIGPNNYTNFPVLNSVTQNDSQAIINFDLDAADSPTDQYRVEFFSNDEADPSGYGEGQTFLGFVTVANGDGQQTSLTLPANADLTSKYISATTTAIDNTTASGFGATSEFSSLLQAQVTNAGQTVQGSLASTGSNTAQYILLGIAATTTGVLIITRLRVKQL